MTKQALPKKIYDSKNGLTYVLNGDYYIPGSKCRKIIVPLENMAGCGCSILKNITLGNIVL